MKHLITCLALGIAFAAGAQTGLVEFPYNPDADNDDLIGTVDLLALLSLYNSEFSEEDVYLSSDSTSAIVFEGDMNFFNCFEQCSSLPSNWRVASVQELAKFSSAFSSSSTGTSIWVSDQDFSSSFTAKFLIKFTANQSAWDPVYWRVQEDPSLSTSRRCYCYTHERPKVEYSYCQGNDITYCTNAKVAAGWYPLSGISMVDGNNDKVQAFWRWAE